MGASVDWQRYVVEQLHDVEGYVFNPRRDDWDSSWSQTLDDENFVGQLEWEWWHQQIARLDVYYFAPGSKSPITLMELGHFGGGRAVNRSHNDTLVCCPEGFWRKGNVDFLCKKQSIKQVDTIDDIVTEVKRMASNLF